METWVRNIYGCHFIILEYEQIFGGFTNDQVINVIIISVKNVTYLKRKQGKEMKIEDVKRSLLKNLNIVGARKIMTNTIESFDQKCKPFI